MVFPEELLCALAQVAITDDEVQQTVALLASHLFTSHRFPWSVSKDTKPYCFHQAKDLGDAALKLDVRVIQFSLLALFLICEKYALLIEGLQIDQVVEGEAPSHPSQVL